MKRAIRFIAAAMLAVPGLATGQAAQRNVASPSSNQARNVLRGYAGCLLRNAPDRVDSFLVMSPFDPDFGKRGADVSISGCLVGGRLRFNVMLLRGALFAAKYRRDFARQTPTMTIGPIDLIPAGIKADAPDGGAAIRFTVGAADCIALRDREGARSLILSTAGSRLEKDMIVRLSPVLAGCAPGLDLARAREPVEAALAEILYRRAVKAPALAGGSK